MLVEPSGPRTPLNHGGEIEIDRRELPTESPWTPPIDERFDPTRPEERDALRARIDRFAALGTTILNLRLRHETLAQYLEQLEIVASLGERRA